MKTNEEVLQRRKELGDQLAEFRKKQNWTQEEMAAKMNVTRSSINKMEKGAWLSLEMLIRMEGILNFRVNLQE